MFAAFLFSGNLDAKETFPNDCLVIPGYGNANNLNWAGKLKKVDGKFVISCKKQFGGAVFKDMPYLLKTKWEDYAEKTFFLWLKVNFNGSKAYCYVSRGKNSEGTKLIKGYKADGTTGWKWIKIPFPVGIEKSKGFAWTSGKDFKFGFYNAQKGKKEFYIDTLLVTTNENYDPNNSNNSEKE
jgi:hypothetical protein